MFWIAFWLIVIGYFVLGATRLPRYYERYYENDRREFSSIRTVEQSRKEAFWCGAWLMLVWPFYETGKWVQNRVIYSLTREERREAEYTKAQQIVKEYTARKVREEREAFDKELRS